MSWESEAERGRERDMGKIMSGGGVRLEYVTAAQKKQLELEITSCSK